MSVLLDASALRMVALQEIPGLMAVEELVEACAELGDPVYVAHHALADARRELGGSRILIGALTAWLREHDIAEARLLEKDQAAVEALLRGGGLTVGQAHTALLSDALDATVATFDPQVYLDVVHPALINWLDDPGDWRPEV